MRFFASVSVALLLAAGVQAGLRADPPRQLHVYFVGNSVTDTINYTGLAKLAESRGHQLVWGRHMIPGAPLSWIWDHADSGFKEDPFGPYPSALKNYAWDVLSLEPFDRHLDDDQGSDLPTARRFIDLSLPKSPHICVYVYSRWPRREKDGSLDYQAKWTRTYTGGWDGTEETRDYFERVVAALRKAYPQMKGRILLVPVGDVLYRLDQQMMANKVPGYTSVVQLYKDGIHFTNVGSYVVGCTYYATLFKEDPSGLPSEPYKVTDSALARIIQQTVWEVVGTHPLAGVRKADTPALRSRD